MTLNDQKGAIAHLFKSKSKTSHILGVAILATIFLPSVFQALDDSKLSVWQRAEKVVLAAGQTLITAAMAGIDPKKLSDDDDDQSQTNQQVTE